MACATSSYENRVFRKRDVIIIRKGTVVGMRGNNRTSRYRLQGTILIPDIRMAEGGTFGQRSKEKARHVSCVTDGCRY